MTTLVLTHEVGDMNAWRAGADARKSTFSTFCSGFKVFECADAGRVGVILENVDTDKMNATLATPEAKADQAAHTVVEPIAIYSEI